jgi:hypothetical protein
MLSIHANDMISIQYTSQQALTSKRMKG